MSDAPHSGEAGHADDIGEDQTGEDQTIRNLGQAGSVIQHAIKYLMEKNIDELSIASALLGGGLGVLSHVLDGAAIEKILTNAIASVRAGELHSPISHPGSPPPD